LPQHSKSKLEEYFYFELKILKKVPKCPIFLTWEDKGNRVICTYTFYNLRNESGCLRRFISSKITATWQAQEAHGGVNIHQQLLAKTHNLQVTFDLNISYKCTAISIHSGTVNFTCIAMEGYLDFTSPSNPYIWFIVALSWFPEM